MPRRCAFLTLETPGDFVIDDEVAIPALEAAGWSVDTVPWTQRAAPWSSYELVVVRSTWDYWDQPSAFLDVLSAIDAATTLANPLALMRWNFSKTYLRDLQSAGVAILPTFWFEALDAQTLARARDRFPDTELVIKPQVGGNGQGVMRLPARSDAARDGHALERYQATPGMLQPFRPSVLSAGEASLFYFNGTFSHAIGKQPAAGEFRSQEERGAHIQALDPPAALRDAADAALAALPDRTLYARIDLLEGLTGAFEVVELELIEPSLYFRTDAAAPGRFAEAVNHWMR